jgi:LAO/AO transport system kinase
MGEPDEIRALSERVRAGETRGIARAMRLVDDRDPSFVELLKTLYPHTGNAYVLGVTGTPGAGKSTLVDRLVSAYRERGDTVGVIAVDPTSPFSGGAILGDRIRMQRHFLDDGVFIRSLATRGQLGGLSRSASDVTHVLDAAGFGVIIVETVGVGQDELEVARLAHTTVVVMAPGMGDDIQAIKAGILEVANVFAVNKADREGADATMRDLEQMIALDAQMARAARSPHGHSAARVDAPRGEVDGRFTPPVVKTVAVRGEGIADLVEACEAHRAFIEAPQRRAVQRKTRIEAELQAVFRDTLLAAAHARSASQLDEGVSAIAASRDDPYSVSERITRELIAPEEPSS